MLIVVLLLKVESLEKPCTLLCQCVLVMSIGKLIVQDLRNLENVSVELHPDLNFIIGDNGSGKSSLLEAIFYLGHGKSFRSSKVDNLLQHNKISFTVSAKTNKDCQMGVRKAF